MRGQYRSALRALLTGPGTGPLPCPVEEFALVPRHFLPPHPSFAPSPSIEHCHTASPTEYKGQDFDRGGWWFCSLLSRLGLPLFLPLKSFLLLPYCNATEEALIVLTLPCVRVQFNARRPFLF